MDEFLDMSSVSSEAFGISAVLYSGSRWAVGWTRDSRACGLFRRGREQPGSAGDL